jgi:hypothetical protein
MTNEKTSTSPGYNITPYQTDVISHLITVLIGIGEIYVTSEQEELKDKDKFPIFYLLPIDPLHTLKLSCTENAYELLEENKIHEYIKKCKTIIEKNIKCLTPQK